MLESLTVTDGNLKVETQYFPDGLISRQIFRQHGTGYRFGTIAYFHLECDPMEYQILCQGQEIGITSDYQKAVRMVITGWAYA